jgi:serine/threonine protein kinase
LLDELLDASEDERKAMLAALKASEPELAQTAERLLANALDESSLAQGLAAVAPNLLTELARASVPVEPLRIGDRVGAYRIVELIDSGGMGSVYRAERDDGTYEQTVAVKFVRRSVSGERTEALLENERSQLARLEHPNIARIIDGGVSDSGELYYVMEYIDGVTIDRGIAGKRREEILAAMLQLCDAVGYCHRSLVVHGDIKPENILLADGRVRLLDFGIGRLLTEGDGTRKPVYAFSPHYASPEQIDGEQPSIPSDIFSLGVVLAQLLSGQPAKALDAKTLNETLANANLPHDLVAIIKRCLSADPDDRYATVAALADDLRAYQAHYPVSARISTKAYLARKFIRRNRLLVGSLAGVVAALAVGLGVSLWQYKLAQAEAFRAQHVSGFLHDLFRDVSPWISRAEEPVTLLRVMDLAAERIPQELEETPEVRQEVLQIISYGYSALMEFDKAFELQQEALNYWQATRSRPDFALATAQTAIARAYIDRGDPQRAAELLRDALAQYEDLGLEESFDALTAWARLTTATRSIAPEESIRAAERHHEIVLAIYPDDTFELARSHGRLAEAAIVAGDYNQAIAETNKAIELAGPDAGELLADMVALQCQLGAALAFNGQWADAYDIQARCVDLRIRRFGEDSMQMVSTRSNMAVIAMMNGKISEAIGEIEQARQLALAGMPESNPYRMGAETNSALLAWQTGKAANAEPVLRSVLARQTEVLGDRNPRTIRIANILGRVLLELGEIEEAATLIELMPTNVPIYWQEDARLWAAELALAKGDTGEAEALATDSARTRRESGKFTAWQIAEADWVRAAASGDRNLKEDAGQRLRALLPDNHIRHVQAVEDPQA